LATPVVAPLVAAGYVELAGVFVAFCFASEPLPDVDSLDSVPLDHRGPTHTIWFAFNIGVISAMCSVVAATFGYSFTPVAGFIVGGVAGVYGVLTHLLADVINPMGIAPFWPLYERRFSVPDSDGLWRADDPQANQLLMLFGELVLTIGAVAVLAVVL
jgi:inner membrane protein